MIHLRTSGGNKDMILRGWKGPRGLKGFVQARITTPSGDQQFWDNSSSLVSPSVTLSPYDVVDGAQVAHVSATPVVTSFCTATASGGSPPYTYAWTHVSDDGLGGVWSALTPSSSSCQFRASAVAPGQESIATFRCTVTDARGATGTADIFADALAWAG